MYNPEVVLVMAYHRLCAATAGSAEPKPSVLHTFAMEAPRAAHLSLELSGGMLIWPCAQLAKHWRESQRTSILTRTYVVRNTIFAAMA